MIIKNMKGIFAIVGPVMRYTFPERVRDFIDAKQARPTKSELRAQAEEALRAPKGADLGKLSREERHKILFGR